MENISRNKTPSWPWLQGLWGRFPRIIDKNLLLLLLSLIFVHFLILAAYVDAYHHGSAQIAPSSNKAHRAMSALILGAAQKLPPGALQQQLSAIKNFDWRLGDDRLTAFLSNQPQKVPERLVGGYSREELFTNNNAVNSFYYKIGDKQWLNFFVVSANNFYKFLGTLVVIEGAGLSFIMFYVWTIYRFTEPLKKFKLSANRLGIDLNAQPLAEYGPSMVRETANAMNRMQERIQDLINNRTQMLAAISHDLHTPITRIRLRVELMGESEETQKIIEDLQEMEAMIAEVLSFSRNDVLREKRTWLDLNETIYSICHDASDRGDAVQFQENVRRLHYFGCPIALKRMLTNLIENGVKYGGAAWVKLQIKDGEIKITIEDNGPGIPDSELEHVFKPYYRSSTIATGKPGTGLGLAIAQQVATAHSGTITLKNRMQGGLRVAISLPVSAA